MWLLKKPRDNKGRAFGMGPIVVSPNIVACLPHGEVK
jgi:hypothetical protein